MNIDILTFGDQSLFIVVLKLCDITIIIFNNRYYGMYEYNFILSIYFICTTYLYDRHKNVFVVEFNFSDF